MLVVGFLLPVVHRRWRALLCGYVVVMALALVYCGEHYVIDILVGWVVAVVGLLAGHLRDRRTTRTPSA